MTFQLNEYQNWTFEKVFFGDADVDQLYKISTVRKNIPSPAEIIFP